jgi:UDP-glucose:(galactosyl)LPS alpha-1,2-glucosyltransferase
LETIEVAFCFDNNFYRQAGVAISSLLDSAAEGVKFNVRCLCAEDICDDEKEELADLLRNKTQLLSIDFTSIGKVFDDAFEINGIAKATYYRLLLHRYFPNLEKIVYSDVDVLFKSDLREVWQMPLGNNFICAAKDPYINLKINFHEFCKKYDRFRLELNNIRGKYFNAGFVMMNLEEIRKANFDDTWQMMSRQEHCFMDQDILNITFMDKVVYLPPRYNVLANLVKHKNYQELLTENVFSQKEIEDVYYNPAVLHFAGRKPWDNKDVAYADEWWKYVREKTPLYDYFERRHNERQWRIGKNKKNMVSSMKQPTKQKKMN